MIINPIVIDDFVFNLADDYTIEWSIEVNDYIKKLLELSPEILEKKSEIEYAVCQILDVPETNPIYQEHGWTKTILIKIKIKNETNLPANWNIAGTELHYYLGSGRIPGCMFQTKQEHLFSGFINENYKVVTDNSFRGIDEIKPYTFKKQTTKITANKFRQVFLEQFKKLGGRQLDSWSGKKLLKIENNLNILLLIDDDDSILNIDLDYDDTTKPLQHKSDFQISLCTIISIIETYLEAYQVEQFATTLENEKLYLEKYRDKEQVNSVTSGYWMPSGYYYYVGLSNNRFYVHINLYVEE